MGRFTCKIVKDYAQRIILIKNNINYRSQYKNNISCLSLKDVTALHGTIKKM